MSCDRGCENMCKQHDCTPACTSSLAKLSQSILQPQAKRSEQPQMEPAGAAPDRPAPARTDDAPTQPASSAQGRAQAQAESRRRKSRPPIDLDDTIAAARAAAKAAAKALAHARSEARTERKRRARLVRKDSQLSSEDLERIAVLKHSGF